MGKRSSFERNPRDFYPTPIEAVKPLIPHVGRVSYTEPCAGNGALIDHLNGAGLKCIAAFDIFPKRHDVRLKNALLADASLRDADHIITNPPWDRKILHPMIEHFASMRPTWLLFDADWMHTKQSEPYMKYCQKIVSVGRVKWIPDSKMTGKDNAAWYLFDNTFAGKGGCTQFYGRAA